jgi:hypothetical protein
MGKFKITIEYMNNAGDDAGGHTGPPLRAIYFYGMV